mgnify:CR=1 FL=1
MQRYGESLKLWRTDNNLTQIDLSEKTGIPQATISWIETDQGVASIQQCVILADYYGISIDELIGREIPPTKTIKKNL